MSIKLFTNLLLFWNRFVNLSWLLKLDYRKRCFLHNSTCQSCFAYTHNLGVSLVLPLVSLQLHKRKSLNNTFGVIQTLAPQVGLEPTTLRLYPFRARDSRMLCHTLQLRPVLPHIGSSPWGALILLKLV